MLAEGLAVLASLAGRTVVAAAVTDACEPAMRRFAVLVGRGDPGRTRVAERWLAETREQLAAAAGPELDSARAAAEVRWGTRLADLLEEDPGVEADLRALVREIGAALPGGMAAAPGYSVAAGRDLNVTASGGGVAAGVIHGTVAPLNPPGPGPAIS
jgi:hypothetical protein